MLSVKECVLKLMKYNVEFTEYSGGKKLPYRSFTKI